MTTLPDDLRHALDDDLAAVAAEDQHWLVLGRRVRLWRLLGDGPEGRERRLRLMELCVERVLPVWDRHFPEDDQPRQHLRIARQVAAGEVDAGDAVQETHQAAFDGASDEVVSQEDAQCVLLASAALVTFAADLDLEERPGEDEGLDLDDRGDDPDFTEADQWGCQAEAFRSEPGIDAEGQRAFWEWYLREAVPRAWVAGTRQ